MIKKIIIISLIFAAAILLVCFLIIYPLFKKTIEDMNNFLVLKQETVLFQAKIDDFGRNKKKYEDIKSELEKIDLIFVDRDIPVDFIRFLEDTASELNVSVSISPVSSASDKTDFWESIGFHIAMSGSFSNVLKFIQKIDSGRFLIEIKNFSSNVLTESELRTEAYSNLSSGDIRGVLTIKVYTK